MTVATTWAGNADQIVDDLSQLKAADLMDASLYREIAGKSLEDVVGLSPSMWRGKDGGVHAYALTFSKGQAPLGSIAAQ
jgi:hypothetical protein